MPKMRPVITAVQLARNLVDAGIISADHLDSISKIIITANPGHLVEIDVTYVADDWLFSALRKGGETAERVEGSDQ